MIQSKTLGGLTASLFFLVVLASCQTVDEINPTEFFGSIDYDRPEIAVRMPEYEDRLWKFVEGVRPGLEDPAQKHRPQTAMILVYTAFYMGDLNYAAMNGALSLEKLTEFRHFAPSGSDLPTELAAREAAEHEILTVAQAILPDEPMIRGFLGTSLMREHAFRNGGQVSQEDVEKVVEAAENDPPFNLFSALIATDIFPVRADLADRLYRVLDDMTSGHGPCDDAVAPPRGCFPDLKLVPFAFQGSKVIAGDAFFKRGLALLQMDAGDPEGQDYVGKALELYQKLFDKTLFFGGIYKLTTLWPLRPMAEERITAAKATLEQGKLPPPEFFKNRHYQSVYQCASCHSQI